MNLTETVKHAPKWAWYTGGGVVAGGVALKLWKNRTTSTGSIPADTASSDGTTGIGPTSVVGTGGSSPGYVIPPVIAPNAPVDQSGTGLTDLQQLYMGGVSQLLEQVPAVYSDVWGPIQSNDQGLVNAAIASIANGGSAPQPVQQNPTPIQVNVPAAVAAPAATPATTPKPAKADPCTGEFPNQSSEGCYKVVCASGKGDHAKGRWHYYAGGREIHVSSTC